MIGQGAEEPQQAAVRLGLPEGRLACARLAVPDSDAVGSGAPTAVAVRGLSVTAIGLGEALPALLELPVLAESPLQRRTPDALRTWALAARLGLRLVAAHRLLPGLVRAGDRLHGVWRVAAADDAEASGLLAHLAAAMPPAAHALARSSEAVWSAAALLDAFVDAVADLAVRAATPAPRPGRPRARVLPWTARWAEALTDGEDPTVPIRPEEAEELLAGLSTWERGDEDPGGLRLSLAAPPDPDGPWVLQLGLRTSEGELLDAAAVWQEHREDVATPQQQERLLRDLARCARLFAPLEAALEQAAPSTVTLDVADAWEFISAAGPALVEAGMEVDIPDELRADALALRVRLSGSEEELGEDAVALDEQGAEAHWEVTLDGVALDAGELDRLAALGGPLVWWHDRWLRVDTERLGQLQSSVGSRGLALVDALALALAGSEPVEVGAGEHARVESAAVVAEGPLAGLLERLRSTTEHPPAPATPAGFVGELRGYQRRGVAWLRGMAELGLGGVLADDMGLGKTVQLIAHLLSWQAQPPPPEPGAPPAAAGEPRRYLVVCPTSVVGNWERELARFAPDLPVTRHHGPQRPADLSETAGVVVTTYGMLRREAAVLTGPRWDVVALDEAQQVKNPGTAGARAVRGLQARQRIALTGTPLENRLGELWALMDATNPGLLGSQRRFAQRFARPIERQGDRSAARRLRRLVAPFVLRRSKADPAVLPDLPEKIERTVVCSLTSEQAELYEQAVAEALDRAGDGGVTASGGIARRGRVLALLTALKQICNHPAQYCGEDPSSTLLGRSGKLAAAREIVTAAVDAGDRVVVFTQYVAMGRLLAHQLTADLDIDVALLHGGVPAAARDRMVAEFQQPVEEPEAASESGGVLVVSLRAGGTGLNLTAATHVLHYDRWWNPAVEDQATDRTHRIGQHRAVEVHKLVTAGTVEERVAALLERKRTLAEEVVGDGEAWITELDDRALRDLVALGDEASIEDLDEADSSVWEDADG